MPTQFLISFVGAALSDLLGAAGMPGAGVAGAAGAEALHRLLAKRAETARETLIEELRKGVHTPASFSEDEFAAVLFRYLRAAQEGAARQNLRLLARLISGMSAQGSLHASDFLRWADVLQSLTPQEIVFLWRLYDGMTKVQQIDKAHHRNKHEAVCAMIEKSLVPSVFRTSSVLWAHAMSLTRTGLVIPMGAYVAPTALLEDIVRLARIDDLAS